MFKKILVANRGEIARRIMNTCREMGITTVALYSDADRNAVHVLEADQALYLGDAEPAASYLNIDKIIAAARETGAEAIHPGYGFLAENPDFAERCEQEGLV
ncbi:MAG: acetyl-CoA carboxylase biotin carboxylase subunit, partial [Deltaproteobacteria bacterium]|nr:acetyl-CoA carboxylase biotin carboxylase subunit [Deltaproteobacteria bacterium]